ncbi:MAG: GTPase [Bacteriovorax sp.]|jgi:tRNA modification GTPase
MNFYTEDYPIIACSTGTQANTAIAVIRLSGFKTLLSLQPFFSFNLSKIRPRTSHLSNIVWGDQIFDNGLVVFFPEGESYTGENVLELSVHGNLLNIQRILDLFIKEAGFKSANPGEFTYRALKNKKLSLSQVEGLDMLLNANSNLMLTQGLDILQGELHAQYLRLYDSFLRLKSAVELSIDFSDDMGEAESQKLFHASFTSFKTQLDSLYSRTQGNVSSLLSPEAVLVGQTNAGKSSLFNLLVKHNRSIVSAMAGTTRDYISEVIHIDGTNYKLVDTAGIRESGDEIENIGIGRAFEILNRAFFKILIINPFETKAEYLNKLVEVDFDFLIISHSDKLHFDEKLGCLDLSKIRTFSIAQASFESGSIGPIDTALLKSGPMGPVKNSEAGSIGPNSQNSAPIEPKSLNSSGPIEPLVKNLIANKFLLETAKHPILLERHRASINELHARCADFACIIKEIDDVAILSSEVNIFGHYLSELIGIVSPDDVLNSIFSNFCIGK